MSRSPPPARADSQPPFAAQAGPAPDWLPLDCVLEIASHVPTATRAAMACVCRDWKHALDGPSVAWHTLELPSLRSVTKERAAKGLGCPPPPPLAARLPAVRALALREPRGVLPPHAGILAGYGEFCARSDLECVLHAASGLTSLHVTTTPSFAALVASVAEVECPGLAALSLSVSEADGLGHGYVPEWSCLQPLTALARLSRLRVAVKRWGPVDELPRLPALRALALELHHPPAADDPEFPVPAWLANNATRLASLELHVPGNVLPDVPDTLRATRLRVTGPNPTAGLAPWLASMTRLVDLEWQCGPMTRWADTVDTRGRLEATAPRLTRLVLSGFPAHIIRLHQVPMPRLEVLQFREFKPRLRGLALPSITTAAPAVRVLVIGLRHDTPRERRVIDVAPLLHRGLRELRTLVLEHASVTASKPAQPGDAARRAFPNLRAFHLHDCVAADVRGQQVLDALREEADRTCTGRCPLETR